MERIKNTIFALSAPALIQDKLYPNFVCKGDELVLDYDEAIRASNFVLSLTEKQMISFKNLEDFLDKHAGEEYIDMYCETKSLYVDSRWEEIRVLAKILIESLGWKYNVPEKNSSTYVKSESIK